MTSGGVIVVVGGVIVVVWVIGLVVILRHKTRLEPSPVVGNSTLREMAECAATERAQSNGTKYPVPHLIIFAAGIELGDRLIATRRALKKWVIDYEDTGIRGDAVNEIKHIIEKVVR
jgi:hypothetical protein